MINDNDKVQGPIKTFYNIIESFFNDDTTYYAASLSFFTIFSLLPIFTLLVAVISHLEGFEVHLETFIAFTIDILNPTHSEQFIEFFKSFISNSNKLGYLGIVYMLFVFTMFIKDYEYIVNKIHKSKRKSIHASFFFYLILLIALPIVFTIFLIVVSLYNNTIFDGFVTFVFSWLIIYVLFQLTVNKKIAMKANLISSLSTTVILGITKSIFTYYVIYNKTYTTIYGSLSTLLFFFFWIYISWIIYLYGVKMCHRLNMQEQLKNKTDK